MAFEFAETLGKVMVNFNFLNWKKGFGLGSYKPLPALKIYDYT